MDIEELRRHKNVLEHTITVCVDEAVSKFQELTGYSPSGINVNLVEVTSHGDLRSRYVVTGAKANIELL